ncbi:MAG: EAL domain-containing protein [Atopobiaceae bacterium]|nr:EAL domain-containing protein [Atopobiaceae bacterium]
MDSIADSNQNVHAQRSTESHAPQVEHGGPPPGVPGGPVGGAPAGPPPGLDPVSGALNLAAFGIGYVKAIKEGTHECLAMWFIDVRNFRSINPKFGFLAGNTVLKLMAQGIRKTLCHDLPVARLGGDRFIVLTEGLDYDAAQAAFSRLQSYLEEELPKSGIKSALVLSGGVCYLRPEDAGNPSFQRPLDYASIAHRSAHENPRSSLVRFTDEDLKADMRRIAIEQSIDQALENGQIEVWFQPQIDYTFGEVIGAEALARWHHPDLGWISPAEFIPILENCGKVHDLDLFIWEEACRSAGRWRSMSDGKPIPISVNVSRSEMFEPDLMEHFLELHRKYDLPWGSLHLEVTESAFVEEADRLYSIIKQMRANKMMVEMDDFGSGLSSLNMLKDVPVDVVKLDMGFMRSAVNEDRGGVVLGSVIRMLQGLDTPIIAEGVETLEQAEMLKNMGCHLMQGFHFSKPMPRKDFEEFIAINRAVESAEKRERPVSHLNEIMSVDASSSYIFNHAIGGALFFFAGEGASESILVNDAFYRECGLDRNIFGDAKINPVAEIEPDSRATLWRAAAEARERGSAMCRAEVSASKRWIECVMRYLGTSARGDIYILNIVRSYEKGGPQDKTIQETQDIGWNLDLLNTVVPNGFIKCDLSESFHFNYCSHELINKSGLSQSEFIRRYHNSFLETVCTEDRMDFIDAVKESKYTNNTFNCDINVYYGYASAKRPVHIVGRVSTDEDGDSWLYALVMFMGDVLKENVFDMSADDSRTIPFEYLVKEDTLIIHDKKPDGTVQDVTYTDLVKWLELMPDIISRSSSAKIMSMIRDLYGHPTSGFIDIKCNLRSGDALRWYHVDYVCDVDENNNTSVIRGYAQDANDQMGSARWWRRQAEIDQLTGLLNRNAVEQEINLSMRVQGAGMMFMIDLDGFKRVNDELGHLAGDALLRDVANTLKGCFREGDLLGRYGGDEFVAFVPAISMNALEIAKRRAKVVVEAVSKVTAADGTHAACSVGIAISNNPASTFYDLLEVADEAMYKSKEAGKGRYTII